MSNLITKAKLISELYRKYIYFKNIHNLIIYVSDHTQSNLDILNKNSKLFLNEYNKAIDNHISILKKQSRKYSIDKYYEVISIIKKLDTDCRPKKGTSISCYNLFQDRLRNCASFTKSNYGVSKLADSLSQLEWKYYRYQEDIIKKELAKIEKEIPNIFNLK